MKILVTGGSGFLGTRLVQRLIMTAHQRSNSSREGKDVITVFCRSPVPEMAEAGVAFALGDIRDKDALEKAIAGADIVYHLAICLDESSPDLWAINVEGTKNVADLCKKYNVKQLVYMSSSGVLGQTSEPSREDFPYRPKTRYEKSKMVSEKIIKASKVPYTIIRTTIILGPNLIWGAIFDAARKQYPVLGSGNNFWHLVYADDVVELLALVKNNKKAINQIFHVASKDTPTYMEVYKMMAEILNTQMPTKHVPVFLAKTAAFAHETSCKIRGKKPKVTRMRSSIDRLVRNRIISIDKSHKILGFEPRFSTREALEETVKYLGLLRQGYSDWEIAEVSRLKMREFN